MLLNRLFRSSLARDAVVGEGGRRGRRVRARLWCQVNLQRRTIWTFCFLIADFLATDGHGCDTDGGGFNRIEAVSGNLIEREGAGKVKAAAQKDRADTTDLIAGLRSRHG